MSFPCTDNFGLKSGSDFLSFYQSDRRWGKRAVNATIPSLVALIVTGLIGCRDMRKSIALSCFV